MPALRWHQLMRWEGKSWGSISGCRCNPGLGEVLRAFAGETPLLSKQCLQRVMIATKGCETPSRPCIETLWRTFCSRKEPLLCHSLGWWPWGRVSIYQVSSVICLRVSRERYTGQVILLRVATPHEGRSTNANVYRACASVYRV